MPFRDDEDARLARLASLENENEDLREELEEARRANEKLVTERERIARERSTVAKAARVAESAAAAAGTKPTERRAASRSRRVRRIHRAAGLLAIVAAVAAIAVLVRCGIKHAWTRTIVDIAYIDGALSVEIESTRHARQRHTTTTQLVSFDLATGARLGSLELGRTDVTYPASGTRTWIARGKGKLALLDVRTPAIVMQPDEIAQQIPELAAGFEVRDGGDGLSTIADGAVADHETRRPDAVPIVLADGSKAWLEPTPRLVRSAPGVAVRDPIGYACFFYDAPSCEQRRCFTWVGAEGTTTRRLGWRLPWDKQATLVGPDPAALHAAEFVKRLDRRCALELDGGLLVRHESSALEPKHRLLSLVAADGTLRWTRRVDELAGDDAMPVGAMVAGDRIHLLLGDAWGRESMALRDFRSKRLVLVHLSATTGETLATHRLW